MKAKKRGKRPGLRARSKNARKPAVTKVLAVMQVPTRIDVTEREELYQLRDQMKAVVAELFDARGKLAMCRQIMEANDPGNAHLIFGPPLDPPQSGSADAEGGTPASNDPEPEVRCPNCESVNTGRNLETDEFQYGTEVPPVVLSAQVLVFECYDCKERWTGEHGEAARAKAVDEYLASAKDAPDAQVAT